VISAGNSWQRRGHAAGELAAGATRALGWEVDASDPTGNELEVWYPGAAALEVTLVAPGGQRLGPVSPGGAVAITSGGERAGDIIHRVHDSGQRGQPHRHPPRRALPRGGWRVELRNPGAAPVGFHAWIERDDGGQSRFVTTDEDRAHTLGSISCGRRTIAVGSYLSGVPDHELSPFQREGPTRDGRPKPEVSAPGQFLHPFSTLGIKAASSRTNGTTRMSGTSMAAPHVTGVVALVMQAAGRPLAVDEIRSALAAAARQDGAGTAPGAWHGRYGRGRVDARACLEAVMPPVVSAGAAVFGEARRAGAVAASAANGEAAAMPDRLLGELVGLAARAGVRVRLSLDIEPPGMARPSAG
jgi:hypothetical protein